MIYVTIFWFLFKPCWNLKNWDIVHSWNLKLHRNTSSPHQNLQNRCWHGLTLGWKWGHFFEIFWDFSKSIFVIPNHLWDVPEPLGHHKHWFGPHPELQIWQKLEKLKIGQENEELWRKQPRKQCAFAFQLFCGLSLTYYWLVEHISPMLHRVIRGQSRASFRFQKFGLFE